METTLVKQPTQITSCNASTACSHPEASLIHRSGHVCQPSLGDLILFCTSKAHLAGIKGVSRSLELNWAFVSSYILTLSYLPLPHYTVNEEKMVGKRKKKKNHPCVFLIFYMPCFPEKKSLCVCVIVTQNGSILSRHFSTARLLRYLPSHGWGFHKVVASLQGFHF